MVSYRGSYPHPVLDGSDDVSSEFLVSNVSFVPAVEDVLVRFQIRMTDPDLQSHIDARRARYSVRWTCPRTMQGAEVDPLHERTLVDSDAYFFTLDQREVRGPVRVEFRIVAIERIPDYHLAAQHPDYGQTQFTIQPGDVLGDGGQTEIEPKKLYDPLNPPLGSCFAFRPDAKVRKGFEADFYYDEHVLVRLAPTVFERLHDVGSRPHLQIATVVLPALMETLMHMQRASESADEDEMADKQWYRAVAGMMESAGMSFEDGPLKIAQRLLAHSTDTALDQIAVAESGGNDE